MPRLKKLHNIPVPQDRDEANEHIARIGDIEREIERISADMKDELAARLVTLLHRRQPLKEERDALVAGLEAFAAAHRRQLAGKGKTVRLPAGEFGWRLRPPRVTISRKVDVIAELEERGLARFIRIIKEVNREAIREEPEAVADVPGITVGSAGEDFWVKPFFTEKEDA